MWRRCSAEPDGAAAALRRHGIIGLGGDLKISDETLDSLFQGDLKLYQSRAGYRFSLDAVLLADFSDTGRAEKVADLGAGNGVVSLILAYRNPALTITGIEFQAVMVARARRNARLNGFDDRVAMVQGDVRNIAVTAKPASFDLVVCNPPYRKPSSGRVSANEERKIARHETNGTLDDFLHAAAYLLANHGRLTVIYLAARLTDLLYGMRGVGLEPKRLKMIHSSARVSASLVLVEGVKGGRNGVEVLAPLVIYKAAKTYTSDMAAMLRG